MIITDAFKNYNGFGTDVFLDITLNSCSNIQTFVQYSSRNLYLFKLS